MSIRKIEARDLEAEQQFDPESDEDDPEEETIRIKAGPVTWWLGRQAARLGEWFGWMTVAVKWLSPFIAAAILYCLSLGRYFLAAGISMFNPWVTEAAMRWCLRRAFWFAGGRIPYRPPGGIDPDQIEGDVEGDGGGSP